MACIHTYARYLDAYHAHPGIEFLLCLLINLAFKIPGPMHSLFHFAFFFFFYICPLMCFQIMLVESLVEKKTVKTCWEGPLVSVAQSKLWNQD
jgi:hypothetical protein